MSAGWILPLALDLLAGRRRSEAWAVPRRSLPGPQREHGWGPRREAAPSRGSSLQGTGWPRSCPPAASGCCVRAVAVPPRAEGTARALRSFSGRQSQRPSGACPGTLPHPGLGTLSFESGGAVAEEVAGRGGQGGQGGPATELRGHFGAGCELVTGSWQGDTLHRGDVLVVLVPTIPITHHSQPAG